jgi:prepilin-type N-terminal cleavage/methylation domain-containing protein
LLGLNGMKVCRFSDARGFTLNELLLTVAIAATMAAIALPTLNSMSDARKLSAAAQQVEREIQSARLRAVATNTPLRFRTNCPSTGYFRIVELLGTAADNTTTRCDLASYPWPASDNNLATAPNYDGALRQLLNSATVTTSALEFRPDGTAWQIVSGVATAITSQVTITVTRNGSTKSITVNGLGKILLQ